MSVKQNAVHAIIGNGFFAATQLIMLVALTQFSTPVVVGSYSLALAITAPAYFLANLKLRQMAITDARGEYSYGHYLTCRTVATSLVWVALGLLSLTLDDSFRWVLVLVSTAKALDSISDIFYTAPHKNGHLKPVSLFLVVRGTLGAGVFGILVWQGQTLPMALGAMVAVYALALAWEAVGASRYEGLVLVRDKSSLAQLFRVALPLGFALAAASLTVMIPRYALQHSDGPEAVALFSTAAYLLTLGGLVLNSVAQAAAPHLASTLHSEGDAAMQPMILKLRWVALTLSLLAILTAAILGPFVLTHVFGPFYARANTTLLLLAVATLASYQSGFVGTILNVYRRFEAPLPTTLVTLVVTALCALPLTQWLGAEGAALAVCLGATAELLINLFFVRRGPRTISAAPGGRN